MERDARRIGSPRESRRGSRFSCRLLFEKLPFLSRQLVHIVLVLYTGVLYCSFWCFCCVRRYGWWLKLAPRNDARWSVEVSSVAAPWRVYWRRQHSRYATQRSFLLSEELNSSLLRFNVECDLHAEHYELGFMRCHFYRRQASEGARNNNDFLLIYNSHWVILNLI